MTNDNSAATEKQRTINLLKHMQARLQAAENRNREPIAVVGIGCRLPGKVRRAEHLWQNLNNGVDSIEEVPSTRWDVSEYFDPDPTAAGKMNSRWGGFIDNVDMFDAGFFGIAPREAVSMDPQQRLALEVAWRALEDSGIPPSSLLGTKTGVFLGVCTGDYARIGDASGQHGALDTYSGTGGSTGVTAGRLSYTLGLNGPSLVVDTACSSSLVATHLAINSLRTGESSLALAGGVNLVLLPDGTITLSKLHMLAPDGRCKSFDSSADGFVRGEGCGILVLQRLSDAKKQGSRILCVLSGSAVNQDGRSSGLTAPSGVAQEKVLREALANAQHQPGDVDYIEAHGTGTALGDPIELDALQNVFGDDRVNQLLTGSVKSNIGHLEAAAGVAGLIKAIGVVKDRLVPPTLHFNTLSPNVTNGAPSLRIAAGSQQLDSLSPTIAGVSSFGFSGTNAHIILESPPQSPHPAVTANPMQLLVLSGRTKEAVSTIASQLAAALPQDLSDTAYTLATGRDHFDFRVAIVAHNRAEALEKLDNICARRVQQPHIALFAGDAPAGTDRTQWLTDQARALGRLGLPIQIAMSHDQAEAEILCKHQSALPVSTQTPGVQETVAAYAINLILVIGTDTEQRLRAIAPHTETMALFPPHLESALHIAQLHAELYQRGASIDWKHYYRDASCRLVTVPGHPFDRKSYWRDGSGTRVGSSHPLVGSRTDLGNDGWVFRKTIDRADKTHLGQHRINGSIVASAAALLEAAASAARSCGYQPALRDVVFERPLVLDEPCDLLIEISQHNVIIASRTDGDSKNIRHFQARLGDADFETSLPEMNEGTPVSADAIYDRFEDGGILYGPEYRRLLEAHQRDNRARTRIGGIDHAAYILHPAALDCALQSIAVITMDQSGPMRIPASCTNVWFSGQPTDGDIDIDVQLITDAADQRHADIAAHDRLGRPIFRLAGLHLSEFTPAESWKTYLYERQWLARSLPRNASEIVNIVSVSTAQRIAERNLASLVDLGRALDDLAAYFADRTIESISFDHVALEHRQFYKLLTGWSRSTITDPTHQIETLRSRFPDSETEIDLLVRCGTALPQILQGTGNPLELVFSDAGNAAIYADPPVSRLLNEAVAQAVAAALPADGPVRILEVGAGTGGTTNTILDTLPDDRMALYCFTDIAPSLVARAQKQYAQKPWLEAMVLDIESENNFPEISGSFDIVIAANVLHATRDLSKTLKGLNDKLRPGGTLVALEGVGQQGWIDLVFGMTKGWWAFDDANLRGNHPMPERQNWSQLLEETGFSATLSAEDESGLLDRQSIIVGHKTAPKDWLVVADESDLSSALEMELGAARSPYHNPLPALHRNGIVVVVPQCQTDNHATAVQELAAFLDHLRTLAIGLTQHSQELVLVTQNAFAGQISAAGAWGLGRAISAEYPDLHLRTVDIDIEASSSMAARALTAEILHGAGDDQVLLSADGRKVARLAQVSNDAPPTQPASLTIDPEGLHVVTGGFGGLGIASAQKLVSLGARKLLLIGRSPPSSAAQEKINLLTAQGVSVFCDVADVTDKEALERIFKRLSQRVAGVVHCAGTLDDHALVQLSTENFVTTMAPKIGGCFNLEAYSDKADYFIAYSSAISLVGTAGQANHIAASAMLDAFVEQRRRAGLHATSLAFGAWRDVGSASSSDLAERMRRSGLGTIAPDEGLSVLQWALTDQRPAMTAVLPIDRPALASNAADRLPAIFRSVMSPWPQAMAKRPVLAQTPSEPVENALQAILQEAAMIMAAEGPSAIDARRTLFVQGFDSLMAVELRNKLQVLYGKSFPSTLLFDYPAPVDLAAFLDDKPRQSQAADLTEPTRSHDIAIVGMACRFPGGANDTEAFWSLLKQGFDGVRSWPEDRPANGTPNKKPGPAAYIDDVAAFDAGFFKISPREAVSMDPQQRILLETSWHALENAGIAADRLAGTPTGVFVGLCNNDYAQLTAEAGGIDAWSGTGGAPSVAAGRLAYVLGLEGPALVVDTACSSSLVAIHLAGQALLDGDCDTALACGANLILTPSTTDALDELNMLSPDGRCKAFDAHADGFGRGEGVGVLVLKRLAQAQADGDSILATIRAVAVNQDGRSSSLTAPSGKSQAALIRNALTRCDLTPNDIDYIEAHGTGTALGDPIEMNVLKDVFGTDRAADHPLVVGAVKSNVAHLEAAAGMAGVIKTVLALGKHEIPGNMHFDALNPHIDLAGQSILLPTDTCDWPQVDHRPRRAGVSSFGFSGTNVHMILQEAPVSTLPANTGDENQPQLLIISAATSDAAKRLATQLSDFLGTCNDGDLGAIANTLMTGRSQLEWRIAVVAENALDAATALLSAEPVNVELDMANAGLVDLSENHTLEEFARMFLRGTRLTAPAHPTRSSIDLPLYPFDRTPYWFTPRAKLNHPLPIAGEHPLLGHKQRVPGNKRWFEADISAREPAWLGDHQVDDKPVLPAAAMIEMMICAAGDAVRALGDIEFDRLLDVSEPTVLHTASDGADIRLHATAADDSWSQIARAQILTDDEPAPMPARNEADTPVEKAYPNSVPVETYYADFKSQGLNYGPSFQAIRSLRYGNGVARAELKLPETLDGSPYCIHPVLLDAAFQSIGAAAYGMDISGSGYRPTGIRRMFLHVPAGDTLVATCHLETKDSGDLSADIQLHNTDGTSVAAIDGLLMKPTQQRKSGMARIYDLQWEKTPQTKKQNAQETLVHRVERGLDPGEAVSTLLQRIQPVLEAGQATQLIVITQGAETLPGDSFEADIAGAAVGGFCATLALEHPELGLVVIDGIPNEAIAPDACPQKPGHYAYRSQAFLRRKLVPRQTPVTTLQRLTPPKSGRLRDLQFDQTHATPPGPGEIAIKVVAAGLNFRDIMNVMGTYPGDAGALGGECAGFVEAVGDGMEALLPGTPVMAITPGCHATQALAKTELTWPLPSGWSFEEAATAPTVYLSALALRDTAHIDTNSTVLIHAAAGGVGQAAIGLARAAGARILATAGNEEKRAHLKAQGVEWVFDSRSADFAHDVQNSTDGAGVDIVLNSLSGELIQAGFDVVKSGGYFLELGKAGVWDNEQAAAYRPDVHYRRIVLDDEIIGDPDAVGIRWQQLATEFATGELPRLPVRSFAFNAPQEAYRYMQEARQIGRIALSQNLLDPNAAYIVTGGTGALGLCVARHLAERGARRLILVSRGLRSPDTEALKRLERMGVELEMPHVDLTDADAVNALARQTEGPVRGIIHTAGILDDGVITGMNSAQITNVMNAKVQSAIHLDQALTGSTLDFFILFSSAAGLLGSAGQANYSAANAALDAFARARRNAGLPFAAIDWGAWQTGMAATFEGPAMDEATALVAFDQVLENPTANVVVLPDTLGFSVDDAKAHIAAAQLGEALDEAAPGEWLMIIRRAILKIVSEDMNIPQSDISARRPLKDYGLDSLLAVQLRNGLSALVGKPMPAGLLYDHPTIAALGMFLLSQIRPDSSELHQEEISSSKAITKAATESSAQQATDGETDSAALLLKELELAGY